MGARLSLGMGLGERLFYRVGTMKNTYRVALGGDHGGFQLKQDLMAHLLAAGHQVKDCGTNSPAAVDYPDIAETVARKVASGQCDFGVVVDGAGIGSAMAANKVPGVLAAACYNLTLARNAREHNGANVLTLGSGQVSLFEAKAIVDTFLATDCVEERHLRRVGKIRALEGDSSSAELISPEDLERIASRVLALKSTQTPVEQPTLRASEIAAMIDHTILKPEANSEDVRRLCQEAIEYGFFSVCVNPTYVKQVHRLLSGSKVATCCVVGFPLGASSPETKAMEARRAIREGASEIDMVINVGAMKSGDEDLVLRDIRAVVEACRDGSALLKVILETSLLTPAEIVRVCEMCMQAGADYVKTSTGFGSAGAKEENVRLMARTVAPRNLGVKASGGIRSYDDAIRMIQAGATRIGASSGIAIMKEARKREGVFHG